MVLFSFSIPEHIPLIKSRTKHQTTRVPRKVRRDGTPPYKVGDKIQLYYRSRMRLSCDNCIIQPCPNQEDKDKMIPGLKIRTCSMWDNMFGESMIIEIRHYQYGPYFENGNEIWMGYYLGEASQNEKKIWAIADGFTSWQGANFWFTHATQDGIWAYKPLDVIVWDPEPIIKRWKE